MLFGDQKVSSLPSAVV